MGCDIHHFREVRKAGQWVCLETSDEDGLLYAERHVPRNYWLFGLLHEGVRTEWPESFKGRGIPEDASGLVKACHHFWDEDAHSESWLGLTELHEKFAALLLSPSEEAGKLRTYLKEGLLDRLEWPEDTPPEDCRIVFWFDN